MRNAHWFWSPILWTLLFSSQILSSEEFLVTNLADSGPGSLREAIASANATSALDTIIFANRQNGGLDFEDGVSRIIFVESTLEITEPVEIRGPGKDLLAIDGGGDGDFLIEAGESRVFSLVGSNRTNSHRIQDLTIQNGTALLGGANISVIGSLELIRCTIRGGRAVSADPDVMRNTRQNADGGGLSHNGLALLIDACEFTNNGTIGNFSQGGGLYSENGTALIRNSRFYQNTTEGFVSEGGGIGLRSPTVMESCEVSDNETIAASSGGGGIYTDDTFTAIQTTISGNTVGAATGIIGYSVGGAFANVGNQNTRFEHCTIVDNEAPPGTGQGGGISTVSSGTISFFNTILAGNRSADLERIPSAPTTFIDLGFNFFGTGPGFGLIAAPQSSSVYGITAPLDFISDLEFHGGSTRTHRLLNDPSQTRSAVDAGPTGAQWLAAIGQTFLFEQRGGDFPRVVNSRLDVGAYEFQAVIDNDSDGIPDAVEEIVIGLDPNIADGSEDLDDDGLDNATEYNLSGISAIADRNQRFTLRLERLSDTGEVILKFNSSTNREYRVRSGSDLASSLPVFNPDFLQFETSGPQEMTIPASNPQTFFQIEGQIPDALREISD